MVWAINLIIIAVFVFIIGMIKPKWIFFWLEKSDRLQVVMLTAAIFMAGATLFGQATREKQLNAEQTDSSATQTPTVESKPENVPNGQDLLSSFNENSSANAE